MDQAKLFAAQTKVAEELSVRYKNITCSFAFDTIGSSRFEQFVCRHSNDIETDVIQAQFHEAADGSISVSIYKLTLLTTQKQ